MALSPRKAVRLTNSSIHDNCRLRYTALRHFPVTVGTTSGTVTIEPRSGDYQRIAPTGNITMGATSGTQGDGQDLEIEITQPASGGPYTVTWSAQFSFSGGSAPAASTAAGTVDLFAFRWNATASRWIERYHRLGYFTALQAASNLSDLTSVTAAKANLGITGSGVQDPLSLGFNATYTAMMGMPVLAMTAANQARYQRLYAAGYATSALTVNVGTSSGNISVAAYTSSGSGTSRQPTGGQAATSGAVACPAAGIASVTLGSSVTPSLGDWLALSCDNTTATFNALTNGQANNLIQGMAYNQAAAHPLPSAPSSLTADSSRATAMRG